MKNVMAILLTSVIIFILLLGVKELPEFGGADNPVNNYVSDRYIKKAVEETGGLNIVTDIVLDYRAFDTFGEATVLFTGVITVLAVLRKEMRDEDIEGKKEVGNEDGQ